MAELVYLIGPPGAGKTTLLTTVLEGQERIARTKPLKHEELPEMSAALLGHTAPPFGGTDTLPMNVARTAEAWIAGRPFPLVIGEGDRLAYPGFFAAAHRGGYQLTLVYLSVRGTAAAERREARAAAHNLGLQNPTWVAGRRTKAKRLAFELGAVLIDANQEPAAVAAQLLEAVPALRR